MPKAIFEIYENFQNDNYIRCFKLFGIPIFYKQCEDVVAKNQTEDIESNPIGFKQTKLLDLESIQK